MYSERFRVCRLSRSDQKDGRLIYEPDYDYYENLSGGVIGGGVLGPSSIDDPYNPSLVTPYRPPFIMPGQG